MFHHLQKNIYDFKSAKSNIYGNNNKVKEKDTTVLGNENESEHEGSIMFGCRNKIKKIEKLIKYYNNGIGTTVIGVENDVSGVGSQIIGNKNKVLNTMNYGNIPQNRERIYILAFKNENLYKNFDFPDPIILETKISNLITESKLEAKYYYTKENFKYYEELNNNIKSRDTVYQWRRQYVRENKLNVCPTLTANMGTGGHNVPLVLTNSGIRKLTPRECFLFQGFPEDYKLPDIANCHLYKQAGNSVSVSVVKRISENILKSIRLSL